MTLRKRLRDLEQTLRPHYDVPIFWDGRDEENVRARVQQARDSGHGIQVIRFTLSDQADTVEEGETLVARHREGGDGVAIEVVRRGTHGREVLAAWDPGLPVWLENSRRALNLGHKSFVV